MKILIFTFLIFLNSALIWSNDLPYDVKKSISWDLGQKFLREVLPSNPHISIAVHDVSFFGYQLIMGNYIDLYEVPKKNNLISPHGVSVLQIIKGAQGNFVDKVVLLTNGIYEEDFESAVKLWEKHNVKLVNISMTLRSKKIVDLLNGFIDRGGIVIASSGNSAQRFGRELPSHYENFKGLTVSASDVFGKIEDFSQIGIKSILAPGSIDLYPVTILGYQRAPRNEPMEWEDGLFERDHLFGMTSASAPLVTGIVSLALKINPSLTQSEINHLILSSSESTQGWPLLNVGKFLQKTKSQM